MTRSCYVVWAKAGRNYNVTFADSKEASVYLINKWLLQISDSVRGAHFLLSLYAKRRDK